MNLPNKLTVLRIIMIPFVLLFMLPVPVFTDTFAGWNNFVLTYGQIVACVIFALASLTDMLDGKIARSRNIVTNLGKFLDPIADKMLVVSVLIALVQSGRLHALVVIIIICREFVVTGIRLLASDKGVVIAASNLGKAKTVSQMIAIMLMMLEGLFILILGRWFTSAEWFVQTVGNLAMTVAVLLTLISGIDYFMKNRSFFKG